MWWGWCCRLFCRRRVVFRELLAVVLPVFESAALPAAAPLAACRSRRFGALSIRGEAGAAAFLRRGLASRALAYLNMLLLPAAGRLLLPAAAAAAPEIRFAALFSAASAVATAGRSATPLQQYNARVPKVLPFCSATDSARRVTAPHLPIHFN
jgi:hypothetical protein